MDKDKILRNLTRVSFTTSAREYFLNVCKNEDVEKIEEYIRKIKVYYEKETSDTHQYLTIPDVVEAIK